MAKIIRYNGNLVPFASASLGTERTVFGDVTQADDITSQFTPDFLRGWGIVGPSDQPTLQDFNAVSYTHGQILSYLHQAGIPEYDAAQEYFSGGVTQLSGNIYISLQNSNIGNSPDASASAWWTPLASDHMESITASVAANALNVGWSGVPKAFRNPAISDGSPVRASSGNLTLVVPSGATLGTVSAQPAKLAILVAYNSGTPVLCVVNLSSGFDLSETNLISPTTISAGSNSASTVYSASAVSANSPYRVVGVITITETTAGIWAASPSFVQGAGGQSFAALQSIGYGQTWQNVTPSRSFTVNYQNTTSRPMVVSMSGNPSVASTGLRGYINGVEVCASSTASGQTAFISFIVPVGSIYRIDNGSTISASNWSELR